MIFLSIIIPHYNSENSLIKLIDTIPLKDEIEVIIVDDNSSTDISLLCQYVKEYKGNIRLIKNTTGNKGAGAARNCGLRVAQGEWLMFADSDDFFVAEWYEKIEKYFTSNYDMVYFAPTSMDLSTGKECSRHVMYKELVEQMIAKPTRANELNLKYCFCTPWSKLIRREVQTKSDLWFDEILASNDIMFITKCAFASENIVADDNVIYCVTRAGVSMTAEKNKAKFMTRVDVLKRRYLFLEENLSKQEFKAFHMDMYALVKLVDFFLELWGVATFFEVLSIYRKNHIKIWDVGLFNPFTLIHKAKIELNWWSDIRKQRK